MRKLFVLLTIAFFPVAAQAEDCISKGLNGVELEQCLAAEGDAKGTPTTGNTESALSIEYPTKITPHYNHYLIFKHDPIKKENTSLAELSSEDGSQLTITTGKLGAVRWSEFETSASITIPSENIIGWSIRDQAHQDSSGVAGAVAGAIFFPPMLLTAPFQIRNYLISFVDINYLDELGEEQSFQLVSDNQKGVKLMTNLIQDVSGLRAGIKKSEQDLLEAYSGIESGLTSKVMSLRNSLLVPNKRKPWCEVIEKKKLPNIYEKYKQLYSRLQLIQQKLGNEPVNLLDEAGSEEKWQAHLLENKNMAIWADANKLAADRLKKCN